MDVPLPNIETDHNLVERLKRAEEILGSISKDISQDVRGSQSDGPEKQSFLSRESAQDHHTNTKEAAALDANVAGTIRVSRLCC